MNPEPIRVHSPAHVALAAPHMLGYWPERSVCVVVVAHDGHVLLIMRWSLDASGVPPHMPLPEKPEARGFHVVIYEQGGGSTAGVGNDVAADISRQGIPCGHVIVAQRDGDGMRLSMQGPVEAEPPVRVSAEEIAEASECWGLDPWLASREEYVGDIAAAPDLVEQVRGALQGGGPLDEALRDRAIARVCDGLIHGPITPVAIAGILVALQDVRVRDTVLWELLHIPAHSWSDAADSLVEVVRGAPDEYVAPPATLLAILRWQQGDGSRAGAAIERALGADPAYSLAGLVESCLITGMHPSAWLEGMSGLSRDACRRSA